MPLSLDEHRGAAELRRLIEDVAGAKLVLLALYSPIDNPIEQGRASTASKLHGSATARGLIARLWKPAFAGTLLAATPRAQWERATHIASAATCNCPFFFQYCGYFEGRLG
jgi:hypothetical protein